jgi:hypothetical protein
MDGTADTTAEALPDFFISWAGADAPFAEAIGHIRGGVSPGGMMARAQMARGGMSRQAETRRRRWNQQLSSTNIAYFAPEFRI